MEEESGEMDVEMQEVSALKEKAAEAVSNGAAAVVENGNGNSADADDDDAMNEAAVDEVALDEEDVEEVGDEEEEMEGEEVVEEVEEVVEDEEEEQTEEELAEMMRLENGTGADSNSAIEINDEEDEEEGDGVEEVKSEEPSPTKVNGDKTSRRKSPVRLREIEEVNDDSEEEEIDDDDSNDVEEVKDDDDSDVMEVEAEDPLSAGAGATVPSATAITLAPAASKPPASASAPFPTVTTSSVVATSSAKSNVVTIDDVKTLHKLAASTAAATKKTVVEKQQTGGGSSNGGLVLIDTSTILAGKATSGVTITPAKPKAGGLVLGGSSGTSSTPSPTPTGVTISSTSKQGPAVPLSKSGQVGGIVNSSFTYNNKGQLNDPNLTDDTFVVEAPSFIVPYVYEKPPKETFTDFKDSLKKMTEELKKEKEKAKEAEKDKDGDDKMEGDKEKKDGDDDDDIKSVKSASSDEIVELDKVGEPKKKSDNYFESSLGKFLVDLGMNLVQETVQSDLLRQQINRSKKDKSASVMHAIMSLKKNLETSKEHNTPFHLKEKKCRFCSFRTESEACMQHHLETPHMKNFMYRCNFCPYETKLPAEVLSHMASQHGVRGRLERAPGIHQCPQCPFEDNMKGKLTRHKNGCDKRFRPEFNQGPPHDFEPPAKIPKPPLMPRRPMNPMGGAFGHHHPGAAGGPHGGQSLAQLAQMRQRGGGHMMGGQFGQPAPHQRNIYSNMPSLQMGPRGRGRPVGAYKPGMMRGGAAGMGMGRQGAAVNSLAFNRASNQMLNMSGQNYNLNNQVVLQALQKNQNKPPRFQQGNNVLGNLGSNSSVTIQSVRNRPQAGANRASGSTPSISITPLPGRPNPGAAGRPMPGAAGSLQGRGTPGASGPSGSGSRAGAMAGGAAGAAAAGSAAGMQPNKKGGNFVICEICDGYIKDLEQLRNHMLWIHKVKIHPKMIHNRPPLNCQKCQFRFFTDQGLERHLLGSHGLVTASMQDLANKGQDSGRCPVCGKVYQWKLLNHVAKDHQKNLKPAHLSYKCTVCTATFGQYKLFESHVYQAHSGASKRPNKQGQRPPGSAGPPTAGVTGAPKAPVKMSDEISVIPKPAAQKV